MWPGDSPNPSPSSKRGLRSETARISELMNTLEPITPANSLTPSGERRPGDEMDSSAGAPCVYSICFDVVTPDGQGCNEEPRFRSIWPGAFPFRAFRVGQDYDYQGPSRESALRKEVLWRSIWAMGDIHVLARSFKDRSQTELAADEDGAAGSCDRSLNPALCVDTQLSRAVRRVHPRWSRKEE